MDYPVRSDLGLGADDGVLEVREPSAVYGAVGAGVGVGGFGDFGEDGVLGWSSESDEAREAEEWRKWDESLPEVEYPEEVVAELRREIEVARAQLAAGQLKIYKSAKELFDDMRKERENESV